MKEFVIEQLQDGHSTVNLCGHFVPVERRGDEIEILAEGFSLFDLYRYFQDTLKKDIEKRLASKKQEFEEAVKHFKQLSNQRAIELANQELDELDAAIVRLEGELEPLEEEVRLSYEALRAADRLISEARQSIGESNHRRKKEAVAKIIERVVCHFRYRKGKKKSELQMVEIFPVDGFPKSIMLVRD